uniref:Ring finger protein 24 n=1 Tax=Strigops habroptila TaxID=2489341 RepID=A0A672V9R2_STRHB
MSSDFQHYSFRMPNIGFQNLPLNIYIVVFGTAIFVFILSLLFCCYLIRLRHQAHKELYAYKQVMPNPLLPSASPHSQICAVCLEEFKPKDELGICPCKHAFHRKCLIKWLEVRKVCPLCNMPVLQLAQLHKQQDPGPPPGPPARGREHRIAPAPHGPPHGTPPATPGHPEHRGTSGDMGGSEHFSAGHVPAG